MASRVNFPRGVEMSFFRMLREVLAPASTYARTVLVSELRYVSDDDGFAFRRDGLADDLRTVFGRYRQVVAGYMQSAGLRAKVESVARNLSATNLKNVNGQLVQTVGLNVFNDIRTQAVRELFVSRNVDLIESIAQDEVKRVEQAVYQAAARGARHEDLAVDIQEATGVTDSKARFLARDQTAKLNSNLTQARQTSAGVQRYEWSTSRDERVRPEHAKREGQVFRWDDPPEGGHPGEDYNCRCTASPVFDDEDEMGLGALL